MLKSREEKNAPFCILDLGGRGGLSVPFKKSEIVASGQPAFFLAGNRMMFESTEVLYLTKKHLKSINGKKKFKRILVEGEKFKYEHCRQAE